MSFKYITGKENEPKVVGVECNGATIQLSVDLHNILIGDVEITREAFIAFIEATGIAEDIQTAQAQEMAGIIGTLVTESRARIEAKAYLKNNGFLKPLVGLCGNQR